MKCIALAYPQWTQNNLCFKVSVCSDRSVTPECVHTLLLADPCDTSWCQHSTFKMEENSWYMVEQHYWPSKDTSILEWFSFKITVQQLLQCIKTKLGLKACRGSYLLSLQIGNFITIFSRLFGNILVVLWIFIALVQRFESIEGQCFIAQIYIPCEAISGIPIWLDS